MQTVILISVMILGAVVFFTLRLTETSYQSGRRRERRTGFGASDPFHAVSIQPAEQGCQAVELIRTQRFLSEEAPGLPLLDCGDANCGCRYIHYSDRRGGARDRRFAAIEQPTESELWSQSNRRAAAGRRHKDRQVA